MLFIIFYLLFLRVNAHSWIACAQYEGSLTTYDESKCKAFARGYAQFPSQYFGLDQGFNHRLSYADPVCKVSFTDKAYSLQYKSLNTNLYTSNRIRLLWPAKNHVADVCTNEYIPDRQLKLYANCQHAQENPSLQNFLNGAQLLWDFKKDGNNKGFQQCVDFCKNPDKAICYGDVTIPALKANNCLLVWFWEFNVNEFYTSCIDVVHKVEGVSTSMTTTSLVSTSSVTSKPCKLNNYLKTCDKNLRLFKQRNC